jgi:beta-lactamase class A
MTHFLVPARAARMLKFTLAVTLLASSVATAQDDADSIRAKQDVLWSRMESSIQSIVQRADAVIGVAIVDLTDQRSFHLNADAVYPTASTIKIAVLAELYRQDERGATKLAGTYTVDKKDSVGGEGVLPVMTAGVTRLTNEDLASLMVSLSDNSATNVLIERVGMANVNAWLTSLGLEQTRLRRHMMDVTAAREGRENTATPRELVTLLAAVHQGRVFKKQTTEEFLNMLSLPKMSYIARRLPADLRTATKPGNLDGVRNDAGIVFCPNRPFAIAVMTSFAGNDADAEENIARIAHAAWSYFDRIGKSSPLGRIVR